MAKQQQNEGDLQGERKGRTFKRMVELAVNFC